MTHYGASHVVRLAFYCLLSTAICSLLYFSKIQSVDINQIKGAGDELRQISLNFFVQCKFSDCRSIAIPFLGYLLNLNTTLISYINLNIAVSLIGLWGFILFIWLNFSTLAATLISAWISLGLFFIFPLNNGLTSTTAFVSFFLASLILIYQKKRYAHIFVILSYCIDFNIALLNYTLILGFIFVAYSTRFYRTVILDILKSSFFGFVIIHLYLLMIHTGSFEMKSNFLNIGLDTTSANKSQGLLLYLAISSLILSCYFMQSKHRMHGAILGLLTVLVALFNIFLYDKSASINACFLTLSTYLLFDAFYSKTEPSLLKTLFPIVLPKIGK